MIPLEKGTQADYWKYTSSDGKFVVGTTKKEESVLNGVSGKPL